MTQPFADHMIQEQTKAIRQPVLGHLVEQLAVEVPVDVHGTGPSMDFGLNSDYKLVSHLHVPLLNSPLCGKR
jgi:hypothetical protein